LHHGVYGRLHGEIVQGDHRKGESMAGRKSGKSLKKGKKLAKTVTLATKKGA